MPLKRICAKAMNHLNRPILFLLLLSISVLLNLPPVDAQAAAPGPMQQPQECAPGVHLNAQGLPDMDCATLDILIRHDRYTIGLLEQLQKQASRSELRARIQQLMKDHEQEMIQLNNLRKEWYGQPLTPTR